MILLIPKWTKIASLCGMAFLPLTAPAAISFNLDAGFLRQNAASPLPSDVTNGSGGALLLLIASGASGGTTFTTPSAGKYVAGGDVVLAAFSLNVNGGASGTGKETLNSASGIAYPTTVASSAYVELRWFPSITLAQYNGGTTPAAGSLFGAYNPLVTNSSGNTNLNPDGGSLWQLPSDGTLSTLQFYTSDDQGGSQVPLEGYANFAVLPVPEPSAGMLGGLGLVTAVGAARVWRRRSQAAI